MGDLNAALNISASGMSAQKLRLRVISENIANADSTAATKGGYPYRRQLVFFGNVYNPQLHANVVKVTKIEDSPTPFRMKYDPTNPVADKNGYVKLPNVNTAIEKMDSIEASESYKANLNAMATARNMINATIGLLKTP